MMKSLKYLITLTLLLVSFSLAHAQTVVFDNWNKGGVSNWPTQLTMFQLTQPTQIDYIDTYHWNNGKGSTGNAFGPYIKLLELDSARQFGPWRAELKPGMNNAPNVHWIARPNITLPPGMYVVMDSDPATWSHNGQSAGAGFAKVADGVMAPPTTDNSHGNQSTWNTNFRTLTITQQGHIISGKYNYAGGKITGTLAGRTLKGWWSETDDQRNCGPNKKWSGPLIFTFSADGKSFTGIWGKCANGNTSFQTIPPNSDWHGTKTGGAIRF